MILNFAQATGLAILDAILAKINLATGAGKIKLYTGTMRATPNTALGTQVLLGTLTLSVNAGATSLVSGVPTLTFDVITGDTAADATGTCTWATIEDGDGATVLDFDVSTVGGNGFGQMNNVSVSVDGPLTAPSMVIIA